MPQGAATRALLGVIALITVIALAVVPVVDARPKDRKNRSETTTEVTSDASGEVVSDESASQTTGNGNNERTLLSSDADGDYIPDSLDNCPNVQNPDQADRDGDGVGDACPIYYDTDGDGVPDKEDNCPGVATDDFRDTDGDGIGDPCDKSPDGVEPEPVQVADYVDQGEARAAEPEVVDGANQDGTSIERGGRSRSRQRSRTETADPIITVGSEPAEVSAGISASEGEAVALADDGYDGVGSEGEVITEGPNAQPYEPPARDNPRRNEELVAEAAASGELYAEPLPPPAAQRAWDEEVLSGSWQVVARIDSGANVAADEQGTSSAPAGRSDRKASNNSSKDRGKKNGSRKKNKNANKKQKADKNRKQRDVDTETGDSAFARGWSLAAIRLQEEAEPGDGDPVDEQGGVSPVPVENGLVLSGGESGPPDTEPAEHVAVADPPPAAETSVTQDRLRDKGGRNQQGESRRNGSSRAAAAPAPKAKTAPEKAGRNARSSQKADKRKNANRAAKARERKRTRNANAQRKTEQRTGRQEAWSGDRFFDGGRAVDYREVFEVAGTDDQELFLTARTGDGPGKRRGFAYAVPVEREGTYLVRFYFVEPDDVGAGERVFSVAAEGDHLVDALDLAVEAGVGTALVKQAEVRIDDGTLDLEFVASAGAPIISGVEVLEPAR